MAYLTIENHSRWPTAAIFVLGKWILCRYRFRRSFTIYAKESTPKLWRAGSANNAVQFELNRRFLPADGWPVRDRDPVAGDRRSFLLQTRLELLIFMLGFGIREAQLGSYGRSAIESEWRSEGFDKKRWTDASERLAINIPRDRDAQSQCNEAGRNTLQAFRTEWLSIRRDIRTAAREVPEQATAKTCNVRLDDVRLGSPVRFQHRHRGLIETRFRGFCGGGNSRKVLIEDTDGGHIVFNERFYRGVLPHPDFPENSVRILKAVYT